MRLNKYNFGFYEGRFVTIRKFSFWQWVIGRERKYCPSCDSIEYRIFAGQEIVGPSCAKCGRNEVMEEIFNSSKLGEY